MSGAHSSADAAQPGRRVRAGVAITFHGPASAWARPMLRFGAVAAPTYPTRDSTTVGSANERDHISGAGMPLRALGGTGRRRVAHRDRGEDGERAEQRHERHDDRGAGGPRGPGHAL